MFGNIWNFVKRHRRKFLYTGVVVGGLAVLGRYAKKKLLEYQETEAEECLTHARKQHHFDSNQRTCNMTVLSMLPNLRQTLMVLLSTEELTAELKNKPANKLEIWEKLKILSFTRTILAVYSSCLLTVFLRVQLNIIGGYMYLDSLLDQNGGTSEPYRAQPDVQQRYLAMIQYFLERGIPDIEEVIKTAVCNRLKNISLKHQMSLSDIQNLLSTVRRDVEGVSCNQTVGSTRSHLIQYLLHDHDELDQACNLSSTEIMLQQLKYETRDMLESSDFLCVLNGCLDTAFVRLVDYLAGYFRPLETDGTETMINPCSLSMPLAKIIPIMNGLIHTVLADAPNAFVQELLLKEQVKTFAANVYEAFSELPNQNTPS
ncbi:hypothetical protein LSH36_188g10023 [Paralvinella palmiformis]|uniref:Peroxisomal biogenesis factor 3 n=1 Tax=Paralvinella palmiformis TaxID=53620 RepID=A0AAD9JR24_9ANNE|nr:hypothetical protein LSH36_188g10023 [Paralvinella palmiformis]